MSLSSIVGIFAIVQLLASKVGEILLLRIQHRGLSRITAAASSWVGLMIWIEGIILAHEGLGSRSVRARFNGRRLLFGQEKRIVGGLGWLSLRRLKASRFSVTRLLYVVEVMIQARVSAV